MIRNRGSAEQRRIALAPRTLSQGRRAQVASDGVGLGALYRFAHPTGVSLVALTTGSIRHADIPRIGVKPLWPARVGECRGRTLVSRSAVLRRGIAAVTHHASSRIAMAFAEPKDFAFHLSLGDGLDRRVAAHTTRRTSTGGDGRRESQQNQGHQRQAGSPSYRSWVSARRGHALTAGASRQRRGCLPVPRRPSLSFTPESFRSSL